MSVNGSGLGNSLRLASRQLRYNNLCGQRLLMRLKITPTYYLKVQIRILQKRCLNNMERRRDNWINLPTSFLALPRRLGLFTTYTPLRSTLAN